ncbi:MAG: hypothetical protein K2F79_08290 [Muribaculaceae bacterium]|nr:hypothetical protein [Muribaculaceae bacterium]
MATYSSKPQIVNRPASELAAQFSDFSRLQDALDRMPAEDRAKVGEVEFSSDTITIKTPQVGDIRLRATERTADHIVMSAESSPVPMGMRVDFKALDENRTEVSGSLEVELPMMLRPLVGPTLQKAADQFGDLFARLA